MRLHLDRDAFRVLLENIQKQTGYRTDVLGLRSFFLPLAI